MRPPNLRIVDEDTTNPDLDKRYEAKYGCWNCKHRRNVVCVKYNYMIGEKQRYISSYRTVGVYSSGIGLSTTRPNVSTNTYINSTICDSFELDCNDGNYIYLVMVNIIIDLFTYIIYINDKLNGGILLRIMATSTIYLLWLHINDIININAFILSGVSNIESKLYNVNFYIVLIGIITFISFATFPIYFTVLSILIFIYHALVIGDI